MDGRRKRKGTSTAKASDVAGQNECLVKVRKLRSHFTMVGEHKQRSHSGKKNSYRTGILVVKIKKKTFKVSQVLPETVFK